jgi:hypothetical protein
MALYRVEHHHETGITPLGRLETAFPHHTSLNLYLPPLLQTGATGWLVLIERDSGRSPAAAWCLARRGA